MSEMYPERGRHISLQEELKLWLEGITSKPTEKSVKPHETVLWRRVIRANKSGSQQQGKNN